MGRHRTPGGLADVWPSSARTAGAIAIRTTKPSKATAETRPTPIVRMVGLFSPTAPANTLIMMIATAATTRPLCRKPLTIASPGHAPWALRFSTARPPTAIHSPVPVDHGVVGEGVAPPASGSFSTEAMWNDREMWGTNSEDGQAIRREAERVVNGVAQGFRTLDDGTTWFSALSPAGRQAVLQEVMRLRAASAHHDGGWARGSCPVRREAHG